ncbi:MAG: GAF domain-containing protein [Anaerolineae bacterium]|nr:GAF domain-containing protein [Anaerolineae bacterium]NUQ04634.1 GAF domain-containing protein [Anaerolineae bacterium]
MIARVIGWLFSLRYGYTDAIERQRARALLTMTLAGSVIWLAMYALVILPLVNSGEIPGNGYLFLSMTLTPLALVLIYLAVQRGRLTAASYLFVGGLVGLTSPLGLVSHIDLLQVAPIIAVAAGGVLLDRRGLILVGLVCAGGMILSGFYQASLVQIERFTPADLALNETLTMISMVLLIGAFLYAFSGTPERVARDANMLVSQWRAVQVLTDRVFINEEDAVDRVLHIGRDELGYSVAQVLMLNNKAGGVRRYRLMESGGVLTLDVNADVVVQMVLREIEPLIIRPTDVRAADHLINQLRFSVSVPILFEGTILGVLDVQTSDTAGLEASRIDVLRALAAQLGRSLAQFRQIAALESDVRDQEGAAQRLRSQLAEVQRRAEGTTSAGWERYLRGLGVTGYGYDFKGGASQALVAASDLPQSVRAALEHGDVVVQQVNGSRVISAPISYRGQMLGAMTFEVRGDRALSESETELVRTVANRLGAALENNRLFEQSQAQAQRERKASDVGSLLLTATDIEQVLALAAETFNEALGATHTRVSLQPGAVQRLSADGG